MGKLILILMAAAAFGQQLRVDSVTVDSIWSSDSAGRVSRDCRVNFIPQGSGWVQAYLDVSGNGGVSWWPNLDSVKVLENALNPGILQCGQKKRMKIRVLGGDRSNFVVRIRIRSVYNSGLAGAPAGAVFTPSGAINAQNGQRISGVRITTTSGPCITVNGVSNVIIQNSDIGPCGAEAIQVTGGADNVVVIHNSLHDALRGVKATYSSNILSIENKIWSMKSTSGDPYGHAIEYSWMNSGLIAGNSMSGDFPSDVLSGFESSHIVMVDNYLDVNIAEPTGAAFTMGDAIQSQDCGHDNYVAGNIAYQTGGVPSGVFGSTGNTVLEYNFIEMGIQAYRYNNNPLVGLIVRCNILGPGSYVPEPSYVNGWPGMNTFSTNLDAALPSGCGTRNGVGGP